MGCKGTWKTSGHEVKEIREDSWMWEILEVKWGLSLIKMNSVKSSEINDILYY